MVYISLFEQEQKLKVKDEDTFSPDLVAAVWEALDVVFVSVYWVADLASAQSPSLFLFLFGSVHFLPDIDIRAP